MSMQTQNAAAERIGGVKRCEAANGSLTEKTPACAASLLGTASLIAAWKSTSESDRDRIGEMMIESGQEPAAAKRYLAKFEHDFIPKQPLPV